MSDARRDEQEATGPDEEPQVHEGTSSYAIAFRQFKKDRVAVFAFFCLALLGLVSVTSPLLANSKPLWVSYKGSWYFPAFKDYLDENFPWPGFIPRALRKFELFSPKYPSIERPSWQLLPNWQEIRREIDLNQLAIERGEAAAGDDVGWYVMPPVPYFYSEDSSAIKLKDGWYTLELTLAETEEHAGERLEFVPRRPPEKEWSEIRARLAEDASTRAQIVFDVERKEWRLEDATTVDLVEPEGWLSFKADGVPGTVVTALRSRGEDPARVVASWEHRAWYLPADAELATTEEMLDRLSRRWRARHAGGAELEERAWTEVDGAPALRVELKPEDELVANPLRTVAWVVFGPTRVWTVRLTAPEVPRPGAQDPRSLAQLEEDLGATITVGKPSGATARNGETVVGSAPLRQGDEVDLSGVRATVRLNPAYILGTDGQGRCVLSRLIHGTVIAGAVGIVSVGIYVFIGIIVGAAAGYFRGWVDLVISRVIEVVICFPTLFLIIMIVGFWQKQSIWLIMIALGLLNWTGVARLVRGEFLKVMGEDYVHAAKALGLPTHRIIFRHVLPNAIAPVFVSASFGVAGAILVETSLSFLGFGVAPPTASWGEILQQGKEYVNEDVPHLIWYPGFAIFFTVTMFNLMGEGLRDALDPKLRR